MRHHCSNCSSEFFDDAPSPNPPARVFCVFCGTPLSLGEERVSSVPFSEDVARTAGAALGVIAGASSEFPETLKQFRAHGALAHQRTDSLSPLQSETEQPPLEPQLPPWRLRKFWVSLAIGFGVGALAAALLRERSDARPVASAPLAVVVHAAAPALTLSGCATGPAAPVLPSAVPAVVSKPLVTPALEKRFWLERARTAQRQYQLVDAERFYRRVLALAPRDSEALAGVGEVELLRGAPDAAGARFREALAANADYVPARLALADLHWQSGQAEEARREYRSIIETYAADLYPPYVGQRLDAEACVPAGTNAEPQP